MTKPKPRKRGRKPLPIVLDSRLVEFNGVRCLPDAEKWWEEDEPEVVAQKRPFVIDKSACSALVSGN